MIATNSCIELQWNEVNCYFYVLVSLANIFSETYVLIYYNHFVWLTNVTILQIESGKMLVLTGNVVCRS